MGAGSTRKMRGGGCPAAAAASAPRGLDCWLAGARRRLQGAVRAAGWWAVRTRSLRCARGMQPAGVRGTQAAGAGRGRPTPHLDKHGGVAGAAGADKGAARVGDGGGGGRHVGVRAAHALHEVGVQAHAEAEAAVGVGQAVLEVFESLQMRMAGPGAAGGDVMGRAGWEQGWPGPGPPHLAAGALCVAWGRRAGRRAPGGPMLAGGPPM